MAQCYEKGICKSFFYKKICKILKERLILHIYLGEVYFRTFQLILDISVLTRIYGGDTR